MSIHLIVVMTQQCNIESAHGLKAAVSKMDYKLVVLGSSMVGKSSIVNVFVRNTFLTDSVYMPTMVDYYRKYVTLHDESYLLQIINTAGDKTYCTLTEDEIRKGDGFLCVFGVNDLDSFEETPDFIKKIRLCKPNSNPVIVLVGNKCDVEEDRMVDSMLGEARASYFGIPYMETSALFGLNINEAFLSVLGLIRHAKHFQSSTKDDSSKLCCTIQ
jgi:small GTP-binding protein